MARNHFWAYLKDREGRPLEGSNIRVYLAGTAEEAKIFSTPTTAASAADVINQSTFTTGTSGFFDFFINDEWEPVYGYAANQQFKLKWWDHSVTPTAGGEIDYVQIFDFIFPVDETYPSDVNKNKMVSNQQAYDWTEHIGLTYAHETHDWRGVHPSAGTILTNNRLVSNDLMFQINRDLDTLLTCGGEAITISASGSLVDTRTLGSSAWAPSADGSYWADVDFRLSRTKLFPIIQVWNSDTRDLYWPRTIKDIDLDTIRIWSNVNTVNLKVTVVGEVAA